MHLFYLIRSRRDGNTDSVGPCPGQLVVNVDSEGFMEITGDSALADVEEGTHAQLREVADDVIHYQAQVETRGGLRHGLIHS